MSLTTEHEIGSSQVAEICDLKDAVYRNAWITYGYYDLSKRLHEYIGNNASWCTFARWSSFTIGESLHMEQESRRLNDVLKNWHLQRFQRAAQAFYKDLRTISDNAMPRTLAFGNHYVFHEIGYTVARFIEWYEEMRERIAPDADEKWTRAWKDHRDGIKAFKKRDDLFRQGDITWLQEGIECYFRAIRARSEPSEQSQLVLRGNILLAAYEQWRLDPILQIALDPFAKHLVDFRAIDPHAPPTPGEYPQPVLRRQGTRWALRHQSAISNWLGDHYARLLTRYWMTLDIPTGSREIQAIVVGDGIPPRDANASFSRESGFDYSDLMKLISIYDRNRSQRRPVGAKNWNSFADRMQFIVELFLALQSNEALYEPLRGPEIALLQLDLDESNLDDLRMLGDAAMDDYVERHITSTSGTTPRELVRNLIKTGLTPELEHPLPQSLDGTLPDWADPARLLKGQEFFFERGVQIATALFSASLPKSYTAEHGARVLTATAELSSGDVNRRVAETGKMLLDIMKLDGQPLQPGTAGSNAARGVRVFHGAIRHMLLARSWDSNEHGVPINQEDLLGTLIAFTVVVIDALDDIGVSVDPEEQDAYVHLWTVVGYLLGIDYALIHREENGARPSRPPTLPELRIIGQALWRRNARPSPSGQSLTASLIQLFEDTMPPILKNLPAAATRRLVGDESGDILEVPPSGAPASLILHIGRPVTRLVSGLRNHPGFRPRMQKSTLRIYRDWIDANHGERPPWVLDDELQSKWKPPGPGHRTRTSRRSP